MENENVPKMVVAKPNFIWYIVWAFLAIAALFSSGGLAVLAIRWFISLIRGGL